MNSHILDACAEVMSVWRRFYLLPKRFNEADITKQQLIF